MKNADTDAKRVLVVEDEPSIGNMCRRVLTGEGWEVDIAINGRLAQDMIEEKQYGLCLIDIRLPKMNGQELFQWIQKRYPQLSGRVIFTTGDIMSGDTEAFINQTGRPFLPKPFTAEELKEIFTETLKRLTK